MMSGLRATDWTISVSHAPGEWLVIFLNARLAAVTGGASQRQAIICIGMSTQHCLLSGERVSLVGRARERVIWMRLCVPICGRSSVDSRALVRGMPLTRVREVAGAIRAFRDIAASVRAAPCMARPRAHHVSFGVNPAQQRACAAEAVGKEEEEEEERGGVPWKCRAARAGWYSAELAQRRPRCLARLHGTPTLGSGRA